MYCIASAGQGGAGTASQSAASLQMEGGADWLAVPAPPPCPAALNLNRRHAKDIFL